MRIIDRHVTLRSILSVLFLVRLEDGALDRQAGTSKKVKNSKILLGGKANSLSYWELSPA